VAEREGFEPSIPFCESIHDFQAWEKSIDAAKAITANLGDLQMLKFVDALVEKVYTFARNK